MKFKSSLLATAILTSVAALSTGAHAATPGSLVTNILGTGSSTAKFIGGATISGGANFLASIPADQKAGIIATITPAAGDVGKEADMYMVIGDMTTGNWYMRTATGFTSWAFNGTTAANLVSYETKDLAASETISVSDLETMAGKSFDGHSLRVHVGYMTDTTPLIYSGAILFGIDAVPSTSCPVGPASGIAPVTSGGKRLCVLTGNQTGDLHLTANFDYILSGAVFVGGDNTNASSITVDAGTTIYGEKGADLLVINRGSKIHINGSKEAPVTMTSANDATATVSTRGQWGGLILDGNAPINGCAAGTAVCEAEGEGSTGLYGGNDPADSSGNLNYLVVKYAGFLITSENELNGISFQGVGSGTLIDYIQVHNNADDGVEFFGGRVQAKHLYLTGNDDDNTDWTLGFQGKLQFVVVQQTNSGDNGIEADNNNMGRDSLPRAQPTIANATYIGQKNGNGGYGALLREGTGANIYNTIFIGWGKGCINIDHAETFANIGTPTALTGNLTLQSSDVECNLKFKEEAGDPYTVQAWYEAQSGNVEMATGMTSYINSSAINALPAASVSDPWFDPAPYVGAVKDAASDWTAGWTFKQ